jgi:hypothetical protein
MSQLTNIYQRDQAQEELKQGVILAKDLKYEEAIKHYDKAI